MKHSIRLASLLVCLTCAAVVGCEMFDRDKDNENKNTSGMQGGAATGKVAVANVRPARGAATQPSMQNVTGTLTFTEMPGEKVRVVGEIKGLTANTEHGFHIHEKGDLSAPDLASAGPHFNPENKKHGGMHGPERHVGDLGNIRADAHGVAKVDLTIENATLSGTNAIANRSILVHAGPDDLKTDPSGNSGGRVAGGVIELKQ
jgi:Cu-Zn family superoxide dismutase